MLLKAQGLIFPTIFLLNRGIEMSLPMCQHCSVREHTGELGKAEAAEFNVDSKEVSLLVVRTSCPSEVIVVMESWHQAE